MKAVILILVISFCCSSLQQKFIIPDVTVQALKPKGLKVTLQDLEGVQQFAFHGNVNSPIKGKEEGAISKSTSVKANGVWTVVDENVELKVGDVLHYWVFVQYKRLGFDKQEQKFSVTELVADGTAPDVSVPPTVCSETATKINGGKTVCGNTIIFEDEFSRIDESKWQHQYYIADKPDSEFATYEKQNIVISGQLNLQANLRDNVENINSLDFTNGCTGTESQCSFKIPGKLMPPIIGAQVKSKFTFKYGKVEIRAQLPKGDWVYPQLYLEVPNPTLNPYNFGRIWLAYARGNADLITKSQAQIGNSVLYAGPVLSKTEPQRSSAAKMFHIQGGNKWSDEFHTFTFTWRPDSMTVAVDGNNMNIDNSASNYNKELGVTLGIAAGGHSDFPNDCKSGVHTKPWKSPSVQDKRAFFESRDNWLPTWENAISTLKIDYIRIWSL